MKYQLKYSVPIFVFIIGFFAMSINMYFFISTEKDLRISNAKERASIIGHRMANEVEKRKLYYKNNFSDLTRMVSQYTLEYINQVKIFDEKGEIVFQSVPVNFAKEFKHDVSVTVEKVRREIKADIRVDASEIYVDVVVPLAMPEIESEVYTKEYGALYLQFDMSDIKAKSIENIIKYSIRNGLVILLMVIALAILIYYLILKPLSILQQTTAKMAKGDMSARLKINAKNELGDLNHSFNEMAEQINRYHNDMELKIEQAVLKNSEQNRMMLQQGRLAAMGEMINNIAHQWRQPLNSLGLVLQKLEVFYKEETLDEKKLNESVEKGLFLIEKMSTTINDFRDFFIQSKNKRTFFIAGLVEEVLTLLEGTLEENSITVNVNIERSTELFGYKNELMQVVLNIVNNAKDALIENRQENRTIDIRCVVKSEQMILEIKDNAGGIPEKIVEKIFDPYFTTKEEGKGTGIGLYMSKTIVEDNMEGQLSVRNEGEGALFSIAFLIGNAHPFCTLKKH